MDNNRYCIIMAGGIGSQFWPISRRTMPKQFLDMLGTGKSFIRHTYERFAKIVPPENFWSSPTAAISRWYWNISPKSTKIRFSRNRSDAIRHPVSLMQPGGSAWPPPTRR